MIIAEADNNALSRYIKLCSYVMLSSNKPIKVGHLQKLANQVFNSALVIGEWINNSSSESKKNFCCFIKWGTPKIYVPLDFTKHLNYLEVKKILKVANA